MDGFIERFDPKESCQQLSLDFLYYSFYHCYPSYEQVSGCSSLFDTYHFLRSNGFYIQCQCHPIFFLNPFLLKLYLDSRTKYGLIPNQAQTAILTYSSAFELYGILDFWNHYVCEVEYNSQWEIYDSYFNFIREDYPGLQVTPLTHELIAQKRSFQFIIWR